MKLEVGMFVRTKEGKIFKFVKIENKQYRRTWGSDNETITTAFELKDVAKASHTLLGNDEEPCLIEVGDYVNGYKVIDITDYITVDLRVPTGDSWGYREYSEYDIRSIVTREQFEQMQYKVGE